MMNASAQTISMLLADAQLPSGGHAYSSGLEPALLGGLAVIDVRDYLLVRARTTAIVDAGTAVATRFALMEEGSIHAVCTAWAARTPSAAMREASVALGRGLYRLARTVWADSPAIGSLSALVGGPARPLVLGAVASHTDIAADALIRLSIYDDMAAAVAALLKLEPRDPADGAILVLEACASVEHMIEPLAAIRMPEDIPAYSTPQAEAWAELHAISNRRLYRG